MADRFQVGILEGARKDFMELDGSVRQIVQKQILKLKENADIVGKELGNSHNTKLVGCREIKLLEAGIRIVYQITGEKIDVLEIVLILAIEKRKDFQVFKIADKRLNELKAMPKKDVQETVMNALDVFGRFEFIRKKKQ
jgi:mRNA interferase RelE/StbE